MTTGVQASSAWDKNKQHVRPQTATTATVLPTRKLLKENDNIKENGKTHITYYAELLFFTLKMLFFRHNIRLSN